MGLILKFRVLSQCGEVNFVFKQRRHLHSQLEMENQIGKKKCERELFLGLRVK